MTARLKLTGLTKSFGDRSVLRGISLSVAPGESLAIMGRSGSGKSTLLKCLSLIDPPDGGSITLDGDAYVADGRIRFQPWEVRRSVGIVFQEFNLFPNMTIRQNISLALVRNRGLTKEEAAARSDLAADALKISDILERFPHQVSGGQAQRSALARAIVLEPRVLLLDEITSSLDPIAILDVVGAIRDMRAVNTEMAVVFVTHLLHFAESFADRVGFLHDGEIHEIAEASEFFTAPQGAETRSFIDANRVGSALRSVI